MIKKTIILAILAGILFVPAAFGTMSNQTARETLYTGDGSTTAFTFDFPIDKGSSGSHPDLEVWIRTTATGAQQQQTETTNYAVSATNNNFTSGGTVTMVTAPASTEKLLILRSTPHTQSSDIGSSGVLLSLENALDKLTKQVIDLQEEIDRCYKSPKTDATTISTVMPSSVDRASKNFTWDATGAVTATDQLSTGSANVSAYGATVVDDADADEAAATLQCMGSVYNVTNTAYGAIPDDAIDDTTALQAAFDAAMTNGDGIIYLPKGNYITNAALTVDISSDRLFIYGYGATITSSSTTNVIQWGHASDTAVRIIESGILGLNLVSSAANTGTMLFVTGKYTSYNTFKDMSFDGGTSTTQGICIWATGVGNHFNIFENIYMINHDYHISIGYDFEAAAEVANANSPNAQKFSKIMMDNYTTYGLYVRNCNEHWFEGDFNTGGGTADIYLSAAGNTSASANSFHTRNESSATDSFTIENGCINNIIKVTKDASDIVDNNTTARTTIIGHIPLIDNHGIQTTALSALSLRAPLAQTLTLQDGNASPNDAIAVTTTGVDIDRRLTVPDTTAFTGDDTDPNISGGNIFTTANDNTGLISLTSLDDGAQGQIITIIGNDLSTSKRTLLDTDRATFDLQAPWLGDTDNTLTIINSDGTNWKEIGRNEGPTIHRISSVADVNMTASAAKTTLFTVPSGAHLYVTHIVIRDTSASLAGGSDFDFGTGASCTTWKQTVDLSGMTTSGTDYYVITAAAEKYTESAVDDTFGIKPSTGSTATASATIDVYGYII